jgi:hypothetical protein
VVQDPDAQSLHVDALAAHVLGALEIMTDLAAPGIDGERVALHSGEFVHPGVGLVEDPSSRAGSNRAMASPLPEFRACDVLVTTFA